jgi:hypothetical protein
MKTLKILLRFLRITKPIQLSESEIEWIKLCKGHYKGIYRTNAGNWIETLKPLFNKIYGWDAEDHYIDFLDCIFHKLLDIHLKIQSDHSGNNVQMKKIIGASFQRSWRRDYELPIERVIAELCGQIQCNQVIENGIYRYYL